jgi:tetratricopeptide (TPR) repeat protein
VALGSGPTVPFDQVKVTLKRGNIVLEKTTPGEDGRLAFTKLTEGQYEVIIEAPGYHTFYHRANLRFPGNDIDNFSARLVALDGESGNAAGRELIPPEALKLFDRGLRAGQNGKHDQAVRHYEKAVEIAPDYAQAWNNLGSEYRLLNRYEKAELALRRALALEPQSALARLNLGMLHMGRGEVEAARRNLEAAVEATSELAQAHLLLGLIAYQARELEAAATRFRRALELDAVASAEAKLYLGSILAAGGDLDAGAGLLEEFLRDHPGDLKATARALLEKIRRAKQASDKP